MCNDRRHFNVDAIELGCEGFRLVFFHILPTVANHRASFGICLMMSSEWKLGSRYIQVLWHRVHCVLTCRRTGRKKEEECDTCKKKVGEGGSQEGIHLIREFDRHVDTSEEGGWHKIETQWYHGPYNYRWRPGTAQLTVEARPIDTSTRRKRGSRHPVETKQKTYNVSRQTPHGGWMIHLPWSLLL